jgi:hypothetical protein
MTDNADKALNPWHPISDPVDLKHLGKLLEELGELSAIVARCIAQGGLELRNPDTGELNRTALENEIADVRANIRLVTEHFGLDMERMTYRCNSKMKRLREWHRMA